MSERTKLRKVKKKDVTEKNMNKRLISRIQPQGGIKFKSGEGYFKTGDGYGASILSLIHI
ncbi:hypothetical protein C9797_15545 [Listeria monocytogenes]|nr:hypothetical protein C9797_15545 [Listeria monocytogenes]